MLCTFGRRGVVGLLQEVLIGFDLDRLGFKPHGPEVVRAIVLGGSLCLAAWTVANLDLNHSPR